MTQVVDGNWGVHADIDKWVFDDSDTPYDYSCTTSKSGRRNRNRHGRKLRIESSDRRMILERHGVEMMSSVEDHAMGLYSRVTKECASCGTHASRQRLADRFLDAKLHFAKVKMDSENPN